MMKATRLLIIFFITSLMLSSVAQAARLSLVGVDDLATGSYSNQPSGFTAPSISSKSGFGGGLLLDEMVSREVMFEIGALYLTREYGSSGGSISGVATDSTTTTQHVIQFPVQLKFRLLPMLHIGVGGYLSEGVGSIDSQDSTNPSQSNSSESYSSANIKKTDYGLLGSVGLSLPLTMTTHFIVEGRYAYGLANVYADPNSTGLTIKNRDIQILAGFTFALGSHR